MTQPEDFAPAVSHHLAGGIMGDLPSGYSIFALK
jgi:hypothetical protein